MEVAITTGCCNTKSVEYRLIYHLCAVMAEGKSIAEKNGIENDPGSWRMSQSEYERTFDIGGRIMNKEPFTPGELSRFYINMGMLPRTHPFRAARLAFAWEKREKNAAKRITQKKVEFDMRCKDSIASEWQLATVVVMRMEKVESMWVIDNIIVLSKEFLRRDPKDAKKEAYWYYWVYTLSQNEDPELFHEVKTSQRIFYKSH